MGWIPYSSGNLLTHYVTIKFSIRILFCRISYFNNSNIATSCSIRLFLATSIIARFTKFVIPDYLLHFVFYVFMKVEFL